MKLAVENFANLAAENKILILGGMAELGEESIKEHQWLVDLISKFSWKNVVLVGGDFLKVKQSYMVFDNAAEAKKWYDVQDFKNSYVLIKGSRSMRMETIIK
jgi:UDP-N-acetylmuramoyl-tripeptide--D-alanyl-D-alanine ligase